MARINIHSRPLKFLAPEILFGIGSRHRVGQYARNLGMRRALVVSDPGVQAAGWTAQVESALRDAGVATVTFSGVSPNPRAQEAEEGCQVYNGHACDGIVSVGGGSPTDCAKGIGIMATNPGRMVDFEGVDTIGLPCPPLICVPTTSGAAADISQFCIILDEARRTKMAIVSRALVPDVSLVDPETTTTMDAGLTATTGMDALVHAIEAMVSSAHAPLTDVHALSAISLVWEHLAGAIETPHDLERRSGMSLASLHAGLAFSNASLGAVHAMSHALGGALDIAHGECNAILLPHVIYHNYAAAQEGYDDVARAMGLNAQGALEARRDALIARVQELSRRVGITQTLTAVGVATADLPHLVTLALQDACMLTNPCELVAEDVEAIYVRAF